MSVELPTLFIKGRESKDVRLVFINTTFCQQLSLKNRAFSMANLYYGTCTIPHVIQPTQCAFRSHCGFFILYCSTTYSCWRFKTAFPGFRIRVFLRPASSFLFFVPCDVALPLPTLRRLEEANQPELANLLLSP